MSDIHSSLLNHGGRTQKIMASEKNGATSVNINENGTSEQQNSNTTIIQSSNTASCSEKLKVSEKIRILFAEVIGTGLLLFFGCLACVDWFETDIGIRPPLVFGLTVAGVIQVFGHISFAIINPAVVIAAVINKLITIKMAILYIIAELIGATIGYGLLFALVPPEHFFTPDGQPGLCTTMVHTNVSVARAFFIEFVLTFFLVLVISGAWDPRNRDNSDSVPLRIGLAVFAISVAGGPPTDASMNPARSFGPALWNWEWDNHWLYWVAPMLGSFCASILYKAYFWRKHPADEDTQLMKTNL